MARTNARLFSTSSAHFGQQAMCLPKRAARSGDRVPLTNALNGANPFDYLTELQRHAEELKASPSFGRKIAEHVGLLMILTAHVN